MDACVRVLAGGACCLGCPREDEKQDAEERRPLWQGHWINHQPSSLHSAQPWPLEKEKMHASPQLNKAQGNGEERTDLDDIPATATRLVALLQTAPSRAAVDGDKHAQAVRARIQQRDGDAEVAWRGKWKQKLAEAVLERLMAAVQPLLKEAGINAADVSELGENSESSNNNEDGDDSNDPKNDSLIKKIVHWAIVAATEVFAWTQEHPQLAMCLALAAAVAIAWVLLPWVLEVLGFGELGPIAESVAARLQMRYMGYVPKGSWFSFFQRLAMVWGK
ncbi:MAG: hypothetical protein STHCBS139747_006052 [Sporothrix thermara]